MHTLAWIFILSALFLFRGAATGRGFNTFKDAGDLITAFVTGDSNAMQEVLARTGEATTTTKSTPLTPASDGGGSMSPSVTGGSILSEMKRIGAGKPYRWGQTGPNGFDCSGLVWRAMNNLGLAGKVRFTTLTFPVTRWPKGVTVTKISDANATSGDIIWWVGHMGVIDGKGSFFGAQSVKTGIRTLTIDALDSARGEHTIYRVSRENSSPNYSSGKPVART